MLCSLSHEPWCRVCLSRERGYLLLGPVMPSVPQTRCLQVWLCPGEAFFFFFNSSTQREHYFLIHAKVLFRFVGDPRCSPPHASIPVESCPKQAGRQACLRQPGKWEKRLEETEAIPCPAFVVKNPGKGAGEGKNTEKKPERHN